MQGTANIFERTEKKYVITEEQMAGILSACGDRLEPDMFPDSNIKSIYFDTPGRDIIERSLQKPKFKEKLRVRSYGGDGVFVELKKKYDGVVYKRRFETTGPVARAWLTEGVDYDTAAVQNGGTAFFDLSYVDKMVVREVSAYGTRHADVIPSMEVTTRRLSYRSSSDAEDLRITFDTVLGYRDIAAGEEETSRLTDKVVMEVKALGAYPLWLSGIFAELKVYPSSFSKYGTAHRIVQSKLAGEERGEEGSQVVGDIHFEKVEC